MDYNILEHFVNRLKYKTGWHFQLQDYLGYGTGLFPNEQLESLTKKNYLQIIVHTPDSSPPHNMITVTHNIEVPYMLDQSEDPQFWADWLGLQILKVEGHEMAEFIEIDGRKPFYPDHTPGTDPYSIIQRLLPGASQQLQQWQPTPASVSFERFKL